MLAHFAFLAASVDIKLPDGAGYAILTAAVVALAVVGILIYILLKKKKQPDDKD
jgi:heme/copper-type cytochrome/quinol oxidase subunit 2